MESTLTIITFPKVKRGLGLRGYVSGCGGKTSLVGNRFKWILKILKIDRQRVDELMVKG